MSRKFLTNVDLNQNELRNGVVHNLATDPSGKAGQIYYNTVDNELKFYSGGASAWVSLTSVDAEVIEDAVAQLLDAGNGISLDYNDNSSSLTIANTGVTSVLGTTNQVDASASVGGVTLSLSNTLAIGGPLSDGSITVYDGDENVKFNIDSATSTTNLYGTTHFKNSTTGNNFVNIYTDGSNNGIVESPSTNLILVADGAIYLGDTSSMNNIVASRGWVGDNYQPLDQDLTDIAALNNGQTVGNVRFNGQTWELDTATYLTTESDPVFVASEAYNITSNDTSSWNTAYGWGDHSLAGYLTVAVESLSNTDGNLSVSNSTGPVTLDLANDIDIAGNLVVGGTLTVSGSVTTLNTQTLLVEDNIVLLNSNVTGTPVADGGLEVERGDDTNASLIWDESTDKWSAGLLGSETAISLEGHTHTASDVTDFATAVDTEIDAYLIGSDAISIISGSIDATLAASNSYLTKTGGLAVDKSSLETALVSDGFTKKYATGNGSLTSSGGVCTWTVTHNLGTKDVTVQVYEVAADYAQVEVDVQHTSNSAITIKINSDSTITADTYRVVVIG